jgi:radical SAM protein with 4Fe4S-binding SPASM domain
MGDPLVHPHLAELVEICHGYKVPINFVTNGVLLKEKQSKLLLHPAFRQVNFSLHSFNDNFPGKDPSDYLRRIFDYTKMAQSQRPDLYINYRLWNLQDPRGAQSTNTGMLQTIREQFSWYTDLNVDVRKGKSVRIVDRLYLHFDTEFIWPEMHLPILGTTGTCYGLTSHFGILADGTVVPCCLDKEGSIPLGNLHQTSLAEILENSRSKAILQGFKMKKLVEPLCQRCQYIERFQNKSIQLGV